MLAQIPVAPSGAIETWLICAAAVASMTVLFKKLFIRKPPGHADLVTQTDLFREVTSLRDKIDARFFLLSEKIDEMKADVLTAGERRGDSIHRRLNTLEANLARVDERKTTEMVSRLEADLASGAWQERNAALLDLEQIDLGYRLLIAELA